MDGVWYSSEGHQYPANLIKAIPDIKMNMVLSAVYVIKMGMNQEALKSNSGITFKQLVEGVMYWNCILFEKENKLIL